VCGCCRTTNDDELTFALRQQPYKADEVCHYCERGFIPARRSSSALLKLHPLLETLVYGAAQVLAD
jgi:hypothetical protein